MASNMAELAKNMEDLDKESATLYDQLGNLEADLRKETSNFDETVEIIEFLDLLKFYFILFYDEFFFFIDSSPQMLKRFDLLKV